MHPTATSGFTRSKFDGLPHDLPDRWRRGENVHPVTVMTGHTAIPSSPMRLMNSVARTPSSTVKCAFSTVRAGRVSRHSRTRLAMATASSSCSSHSISFISTGTILWTSLCRQRKQALETLVAPADSRYVADSVQRSRSPATARPFSIKRRAWVLRELPRRRQRRPTLPGPFEELAQNKVRSER